MQASHAQPHALRIQADHLDPRAGAVAEHVGTALARILTQHRADRPQQPINPAPKVHRLRRQPPTRRTQHNARTRAATSASGTVTCSRTPFGNTSSTSMPTRAAAAGSAPASTTTGTKAMGDDRRCQYTNCEYGNPRARQTAAAGSPLDRHAATRFDHTADLLDIPHSRSPKSGNRSRVHAQVEGEVGGRLPYRLRMSCSAAGVP